MPLIPPSLPEREEKNLQERSEQQAEWQDKTENRAAWIPSDRSREPGWCIARAAGEQGKRKQETCRIYREPGAPAGSRMSSDSQGEAAEQKRAWSDCAGLAPTVPVISCHPEQMQKK